MTPDDSVGKILASLQERAKELQCLYRIHELTEDPDTPIEETFRRILEAIPAGWQYPEICWARIRHGTSVYEPGRHSDTPWVQRAPIVVGGTHVGAIEVFYGEPRPGADEGPFLKEERKLIDTIADRIGHWLARRQIGTRRDSDGAVQERASDRRPEWKIIVDFLESTDEPLLTRLTRRMLNHLAWSGIPAAQELLQRSALRERDIDLPEADNRPALREPRSDARVEADRTFGLAAVHMGEREIVSSLQRWIKDDRASFLIEAVENQGSSIQEIAQALERHHRGEALEADLARATQIGLRVSLIRRLFTDDLDYVNVAKSYFELKDVHRVLAHVIAPAPGFGKLGGKAAGLLLAEQIVRKSPEYADLIGPLRVPRTWHLTSDGLIKFITFNQLQDFSNRKYLELDQIRREYPNLIQVFKHSRFPPEIVNGLSLALDDLETRPLIVRSSSLLEDRMGYAFAGKYKSLFLANQGGKTERLQALMDAIAEVYASALGPDPIEYRAARGLLDLHEEMGILIQEVVGTRVGRYFFPAFAGVAFSHNELRWSPRIRREDGLLRLVPGLGTRAVDRLTDDHPVLVAPGQPGLRVNVNPDEVFRYAPKKADVINLESGRFETVEVARLLAEYGSQLPAFGQMVSICDRDGVREPIGFEPGASGDALAITFEGLIRGTPFVSRLRALLTLLRERFGTAIDLEFASDGRDLFLLQCRPQSFSDASAPAAIPRDLPRDRLLFTANRYVSNGTLPDITHLVYIDPDRYGAVSDVSDLHAIGRAVGRLNTLLPKRRFILMGPGRWGSRGDIKLGVKVTYSDINNTAALVEIARRRGGYLPDLSFGTHFFQDLVEANIRYLPLFPDEPGVVFNELFLTRSPNVLPDLLPEFTRLAEIIRVVDVPRATGGLMVQVLMNADLDEAVGVLAPSSGGPIATSDKPREPTGLTRDHWRWRQQMAERLAGSADAARFGIRALYLFGSVKNATAGPGSDIDLLVHFDGNEEQRRALDAWLEGWSLCLAEMNYQRTGYRSNGLLDVHVITDEDIVRETSFASKIGAVTDAARPLPLAVPPVRALDS